MSSLLEQAIIDAQQLREAALKSAEAAVTEKYSKEIKSLMGELLEEQVEGEVDVGTPADLGSAAEVPYAALDGEDACPCPDDVAGENPDDDPVISVDLDQLAARAASSADGTPEPIEKAAEDITNLMEDSEDLEEDLDSTPVEEPLEEEQEEIELSLDEEVNITEDDILSILEDMDINVDLQAVARGWAGQSRAESEEQIHQNLASLKDTESGLERKELLNKIDELEESIKRSSDTVSEYKTLAENLAEKLGTVNLSNAKLLYINKTLGTPSLNERQIQTVVEAISRANTAEEAKVIFDTLQSTVGAASNREALPQSLSEAVNRKKPAMLVSRPRRPEQNNDKVMQNFADRMRKLAGINKT